jgi:hypothetical protein
MVQNPDTKTTYVLVARPPAGPWTITAQPGSTPIADVQQAEPLPAPAVHAKVTGHGFRRRLTWTLNAIRGQQVSFVERSGSVARVLKRTRAASGSIAFQPTDGPGGGRRIEAVVEQDGFVREVDRVARYTAPKPRRPAAPKLVRLAVSKSRLTVRWAKVAGAKRYRVYATINGGRHVLIAPRGHALEASMSGVFADAPVKIAVAAVDEYGHDGARGRASRKPDKVRKVVLGGVKAKPKAKHRS